MRYQSFVVHSKTGAEKFAAQLIQNQISFEVTTEVRGQLVVYIFNVEKSSLMESFLLIKP